MPTVKDIGKTCRHVDYACLNVYADVISANFVFTYTFLQIQIYIFLCCLYLARSQHYFFFENIDNRFLEEIRE